MMYKIFKILNVFNDGLVSNIRCNEYVKGGIEKISFLKLAQK